MTQKEEFLKQCIVLDTETTGKDYKTAEIIETGFVIKDGTWEIFQDLHSPINGTIPAQVQSICYITDEMVSGYSPFVEVSDRFQRAVNGFLDGYAVGHNYFYDMKVLQNHGIKLPKKSICTWRMAKKLLSEVPSIEETNLPYLRFALKLDIPIEMRCHRAGNDSYMTAKLLEFFIEMMEEMGILDKELPYGPQIEEWLLTPIIYPTFPFGKHKGQKFSDIPVSYWDWAMKNTDWFDEDADDFDPDLLASIKKAIDEK